MAQRRSTSVAHGARPTRPQKKGKPPAGRGPLPSIVALVLVVGTVAAIMANVFTVKHVEVIGANLPVARIIATADVSGKNMFRVRSDAVVARLDTIPQIEVSRVDTSFPWTVRIYATLRRPFGAWQSGQLIFMLDQTGRIIGQAAVPPAGLPLLSGGTTPPGFAILEASRYALQLLPSQTDGAIAQLQVDPSVGMKIIGRSGWQAVIGAGDPQTLVKRVATLGALLRAIAAKGQGLKFADLRYREPYYRPR